MVRPRAQHRSARLLRIAARFGLMAAMSALLPTCSAPTKNDGEDPRKTAGLFVANSSDFRGFHQWASYDVTDDAELAGIHDGSTVTEYINELPPSGSDEFPLGT